jgi:hypothetical protein
MTARILLNIPLFQALTNMAFLFEGNPGHEEFTLLLSKGVPIATSLEGEDGSGDVANARPKKNKVAKVRGSLPRQDRV